MLRAIGTGKKNPPGNPYDPLNGKSDPVTSESRARLNRSCLGGVNDIRNWETKNSRPTTDDFLMDVPKISYGLHIIQKTKKKNSEPVEIVLQTAGKDTFRPVG